MTTRDEVAAFGLSRRDRAKALSATGDAIRAALHRDDAPDNVLGVLAIVVRMKADRTPDVAVRNCVVWGEDGLTLLATVARDTIQHVAARMGTTIDRKREGH